MSPNTQRDQKPPANGLKKGKTMSKKSKKEQRVHLLTEKEKMDAIKKLLNHGPRGSEWAETGMLHMIEDIINNKITDVSSKGMEKIFKEIRHF